MKDAEEKLDYTVDELIALTEYSKTNPEPVSEEVLRMLDRIIKELRAIGEDPVATLSVELRRSIVDGPWDLPIFRPLMSWMDARYRKTKKKGE